MTSHPARTRPIEAVIFDKDGTLFDFHASWGVWARGLLTDLAQGDQSLMHRLADSLRFDLSRARFHPDSFVIADTPAAVALVLADELPHGDADHVLEQLNAAAERIAMVEAAPLVPLVLELEARGLSLAVVTNDAEGPARTHLAEAGILHAFDMIVGFDSGFGAKPSARPLLACARHLSIDPAHMVMVGDSTHDLRAGRAAGMRVLGVLTGPASHDDLAPLADAVLPHVGHLPGWLDTQRNDGIMA